MDDKIAKVVLDKLDFFEYIEPNYITIIGFVLNFYIFTAIVSRDTNFLPILMMLRWLADTLDGNVARKYNKTSKIGNYLDVFSDTVLFCGVVYLLATMYNIDKKYVFIFCIAVLCLLTITSEMLNENKKEINKNTTNPITKLSNFFIDNSMVQYMIFFAIYMHGTNNTCR